MKGRRILGLGRARAALLAVALACLSLACALGAGDRAPEPVARQEWQHARGPVVPHATFPRDCALCHLGGSWHEIRADFQFDHAAETGTALVGAHDEAECLRCHNDRGAVAHFAAQGCVGCHADPHQGRLGRGCTDCHAEDARDWRARGAIAEHARTRFPLVGVHATTACWACHPGAQVGNFQHASMRCVDCHAADLRAATNPDHVLQGWTDGCERCHTPTEWSRAGFEHGFFPLTGGHGGLACADCHAPNDFGGLDDDCFACHADDYQAARRPDHVSNGFPTACEQCHTTQTWGDGEFDHPQFPIQGGAHGGLACQQCHPVPGNFRQFTCLACHAHSAREMDDEHDRVRGYVYSSGACYDCHPAGQER
jgi:hypothetical protein